MDNLEILIDDRFVPGDPGQENLLTEHGLSIYFEKDGYKWMIDTGLSEQFAKNAACSGIDISQINHLIISHNHDDHTGGLGTFLRHNSKALIHLSEWIRESTCFSVRNNIKMDIGLDRGLLKKHESRFVWHPSENIQLTDHVWLLANIPDTYPLPMANAHLSWKHKETEEIDPFYHEMALLIKGEKNTVISACSHKGIANTLEAALGLTDKPISAFVGGTHLRDGYESEEDMLNITSLIIKRHPQLHLFTGHCTGDNTMMVLKRFLPGRVTPFCSGFRTEI